MKNLKCHLSRLVAVALMITACGGVDDGSSSDDVPVYDRLEAESLDAESEPGTIESSDDAPAPDSLEAQSLDAESNPDVVEKSHCPIFPIYGCVEYSPTKNIAGCMCVCNNKLTTLKRSAWSPSTYVCV